MSTITDSKRNLQFCDDTIKLAEKIEMAFLETGLRLVQICDKKMWQGRWEDFDDFCEDGMKMDRSKAYKLMDIYRTLVIDHKVEPERLCQAGWTRLSAVMPAIKSKDDVEEWVNQAIHARSRTELQKLVVSRIKNVDPMHCEHKNTKRMILVRCSDCGESWREYEK